MHGIKALAAAASLAVLAIGSQAKASTDFTLVSASMNQQYDANIVGFGEAISNGVTFTVQNYPGVPGTSTLFGFCIDIYHDMYLGNLGYTYSTNQPAGGGLAPNAGTVLDATQVSKITNLVDTGFLLNEQSGGDADTILKLAAIQSAIWSIEVPTTAGQPTVTLVNGGATVAGDTTTYQEYFDAYRTGAYTSLAKPGDRVFTISDTATDPSHQTFAVGWPAVPEPATWAMMLVGFGGMGVALRRSRKATAATA